jgi:myo-inositol-1(or 4)-monophosphatase
MANRDDLNRIEAALSQATHIFSEFTPGRVASLKKAGGDPVTEADKAIDAALLKHLPQRGEGWLSEETVDDGARLNKERVWVVDPLDGTREFVEGLPEFCVSVALVESGNPTAGGILNPSTGEKMVGAAGLGVWLNDEKTGPRKVESVKEIVVLASRSEHRRGQWTDFEHAGLGVQPMGSVAYKIARVAAGLADATFTLVPKNEWDVAGGAALLLAGGGRCVLPDGSTRRFNQKDPLMPGFVAAGADLLPHLLGFIESVRGPGSTD